MSTPAHLLQQQLREVAERRIARDLAAGELKAKRAAFDLEHAALLADVERTAAALAESEKSARTFAVAIYEADKSSKTLCEGVAIRVSTKLVYDPTAALARAKVMGVAVIPESLDTKAFEKIAKASPESFPFVSFVDEPSAALGSDLSVYLTPVPTTEGAPL